MTDLPRSQALRCFVTVAREGTVSRAASLLHLTQPAVSLQLKALEEATGLQLSTGRPEAGAALLPLAHKAVSTALDFRAAANALKQSQCSTLRVGTILDPEFIRLGPFVRSLTASSQNIEMFLRHGMSDDVLTQIGRGELDLGYYIDATPDPAPPPRLPSERSIDGCKFQLAPLLSYTYRVVAPAEWSDKVLGKGWADLAALPWLATPSPSAHRRLLDDVFRPFGPLPKRVGFTDQEEAMIGFVESGVCLSLARDGVLERITRQRDFVIADKVSLACNLSFGCHATPGAGDFAGLCGDAHGI
jgi:DNA-binding transcriptional LysR family regulator